MSANAQLDRGLDELGLSDVPQLAERLLSFTADLIKWNKVYNLTAIKHIDEIVTSHLLDSLSIHEHLNNGTMVDVGTGGGFPGVPIKMLLPDIELSLLDSNVKKTRFLQQVVINHQLPKCNVLHSRAEDCHQTFDQVVCRAFASLPNIVDFAGHLVAKGGRLLAMKGKVEDELNLMESCQSDMQVVMVEPLYVPGLQAERHLVVMQRERSA